MRFQTGVHLDVVWIVLGECSYGTERRNHGFIATFGVFGNNFDVVASIWSHQKLSVLHIGMAQQPIHLIRIRFGIQYAHIEANSF